VVPKVERTINTIPTAKKYNPKIKTEYFFNNSFISISNIYLLDIYLFKLTEKICKYPIFLPERDDSDG
jgi:hypothetical protein